MKKLLSSFTAAFFIAANAQAAPMYLNFHNSDLRSTIMMVARMGDINISLDDSVDGKISINLNGVEPEKALEIIAKTKNLNLIKDNGIYILTKEMKIISPMKAYVLPIKYGNPKKLRKALFKILDFDDKESVLKSLSLENVDGIKRTYNYISSAQIKKEYDFSSNVPQKSKDETKEEYEERKDDYDEGDPRAKRVFINPEINALILFGTESEYERAKKLLEELDVELKQVSVEARILAIDKDASKNLGVDWFWSTLPQFPEYDQEITRPTYHSDGSLLSPGYIKEKYTRKTNDNTGYGIIQFGRGPLGIPFEFYYGAKINALVTDGKAKILSRPNVTTIQGHEAIINVGNSVPVPKVSSNNSSTTTEIEYKDAGIILKYTPRVNVDGTITATIHTEVSTPQYVEDLKAYRFNTRSADTVVTVRDGEPMVIGGLIGAEEAKSVSKIPFLGDLPILGALFKNHRKSKNESELLIFLTAHVINGAGVGVPDNVRYSVPAGNLPHENLFGEK